MKGYWNVSTYIYMRKYVSRKRNDVFEIFCVTTVVSRECFKWSWFRNDAIRRCFHCQIVNQSKSAQTLCHATFLLYSRDKSLFSWNRIVEIYKYVASMRAPVSFQGITNIKASRSVATQCTDNCARNLNTSFISEIKDWISGRGRVHRCAALVKERECCQELRKETLKQFTQKLCGAIRTDYLILFFYREKPLNHSH